MVTSVLPVPNAPFATVAKMDSGLSPVSTLATTAHTTSASKIAIARTRMPVFSDMLLRLLT